MSEDTLDEIMPIEIEEIEVPKIIRHADEISTWLEVPTVLLALLNLSPENFTQEARRGLSAMFLDEDFDAATFLSRFLHIYGASPELAEPIDYGKWARVIRDLPRNEEGRPVTIH